jgi:transcriptional regulator with XRE-family HTH domain
MPTKDPKRRPPSALGKALKTYRETYKLIQEGLAALLDEDPRQIRRWENNETSVKDPGHLKVIADRLSIPYEHLGISPSIYIPLTLEQINTTVDRIWFLRDEGRINEAHAIAENLVREATHQLVVRKQDAAFYHRMVRRHGKPKAITALAHKVLVIIYHLLRTKKPYTDLGAQYFDQQDRERIERHHLRRLEQLGYNVTLTPKEAA